MSSGWRNWIRLIRFFGRSRPSRDDQAPFMDLAPKPTKTCHPVLSQLDAIEALALELYSMHGLPTKPGQYARSPGDSRWKFIGDSLGAEERWMMVTELGSTKGWSFRALEEIGAEDGQSSNAVDHASRMLSACRALRQSLETGRGATTTKDDIATALTLGGDWKQASWVLAKSKTGTLKFGDLGASDAELPGRPARARQSKKTKAIANPNSLLSRKVKYATPKRPAAKVASNENVKDREGD